MTHTHTRACARTHTHTHTRVRAHTHTQISNQTEGHMCPTFVDSVLQQLLYGCLHSNPSKRLTAQECAHLLSMAAASTDEDRDKVQKAYGCKYIGSAWNKLSVLIWAYQKKYQGSRFKVQSAIQVPLFWPQSLSVELWNILGGPINEVLVYKPTPTFALSEWSN